MKIIIGKHEDSEKIAPLIAAFRVELRALKNITSSPNLSLAKEEYQEYLNAGYPMYLAEEDGKCKGYIICRVEGTNVWVESIYVKEECRRLGIASELYKQAEALANSLGEETLYNYVHPNNHKMIQFLKKRGYSVLNLIEIRRPYADEHPESVIQVGDNLFDY